MSRSLAPACHRRERMTKYSILSFYPQQIIQPLFLHVEVLNTKEDDCLVTMASKRHLRVASDVQLKVAAEKGYKVVASLDKVAEARGPSVVCHLLSSSRQQLPHLSCYININIVVDEERADMFLHHAPVPLAAEKKCSDRVDAGGGGGGGGDGTEGLEDLLSHKIGVFPSEVRGAQELLRLTVLEDAEGRDIFYDGEPHCSPLLHHPPDDEREGLVVDRFPPCSCSCSCSCFCSCSCTLLLLSSCVPRCFR
mmetsp:Transcript_2927/g.9865  ORF Transcript_2927/g.9865 Transcript_2927/m.9865 type:complete len:251 (+) Transcript_2927:663-1415(+)